MNTGINGKVVAITGASSGIGEAIALMLARRGAKVIAGARRKERLEQLRDQARQMAGDVTICRVDVTKYQHLTDFVACAYDRFGKLDAIVNNAGIAALSRIDELDVAGWEAMIDVNLKGVLYGIAAAIPIFQQQGYGHIINIISTSGLKIVPMQGVYAGTKNAVRTIAEAFRQESDGRIKITGISPGVVKTNLADTIQKPEMRAAINDSMGQIGISPDAIAEAVIYALQQPPDVEIGDIIIRPAAQH